MRVASLAIIHDCIYGMQILFYILIYVLLAFPDTFTL